MAQILILEQDKRHFQLVKNCLETKGHTVLWTAKTAEGLELLSKYTFDLIVSAVNLDTDDVFEFLRAVRNGLQSKTIPVVFCCADPDRSARFATSVIRGAAKSLGARKYILLPGFDATAQLWEELQECLPENAIKKDVLGGPVQTYSINASFWTAQKAS
jgi:CheY-like chemotaxis protein